MNPITEAIKQGKDEFESTNVLTFDKASGSRFVDNDKLAVALDTFARSILEVVVVYIKEKAPATEIPLVLPAGIKIHPVHRSTLEEITKPTV